MSDLFQSLSHSRWDCKYHVVFVPKRRRKVLFGKTRRHLGEVFHALARQKECQILDGHLMPDHVHMCIAIPPKHPVASVIGFLKGKSAIAIARLCGKERNFTGEHFWARGYAVSTVGFELEQVRDCVCLRLDPHRWVSRTVSLGLFRRRRSAVKLPTLLDVRGSLSISVLVTGGQVHDVNRLEKLRLEAGAFYSLDRGEVDFACLHIFPQACVCFIRRAKKNMLFYRRASRPVGGLRGVRRDQTILPMNSTW